MEQYPSPVIAKNSRGAEDIKYGFEGGRVVKIGGIYHLITTEMAGDPFAVKTRIGYWTSSDRILWRRLRTLFESSGDFTGKDSRAALWGPMMVYNGADERWELFYVAYRAAPDTKTEMRANFEGRIWRAVSEQKGYGGIGGPYKDVGIILQPDAHSQPWEGLQGTDSFFPYRVGKRWLAFYGSANTEHLPIEHWRVGLAEAQKLAGPWTRITEGNPVPIEPKFAENPIVTPLSDGNLVAVYDNDVEYSSTIGYSWSALGDGVHWARGKQLTVQPKGKGFWADTVRTPLGLIPERDGDYTLFYTGYQKPRPQASPVFGGVGFVTVNEKETCAKQ